MKRVKFDDKEVVEKDQKEAKRYYSPSDIHKALSCPCPISMDVKDDKE